MSFALISCLFDTIFAAQRLMRAVGFCGQAHQRFGIPISHLAVGGSAPSPNPRKGRCNYIWDFDMRGALFGEARHASPSTRRSCSASGQATRRRVEFAKVCSMGFCVSTTDPRPVFLGGGFVFFPVLAVGFCVRSGFQWSQASGPSEFLSWGEAQLYRVLVSTRRIGYNLARRRLDDVQMRQRASLVKQTYGSWRVDCSLSTRVCDHALQIISE